MEEGRECDSAIPEMPADSELREMISVNVICRLCANQNDKLIGIFSEGGINNELATKMNLYLPIKVHETDDLPLQCCWQCASTVLAWHELVVASVEADRRLRSYQFVTDKGLSDDVRLEVDVSKADQTDEGNFVAEDAESSSDNETSTSSKTPIADPSTTVEYHKSVDLPSKSCKLCSISFPNKLRLKEHMSVVHDIKRPKFRRKKTELDAPFKCDFCDKTFTRNFDMRKHVIGKHPDRSDGIKQSNRKRNAKILENCRFQGTDYEFQCDFCEKKFVQSQRLLRHRRTHSEEKGSVCEICGKKFSFAAGLRRHIEQFHLQIKKFGCDICGKKFNKKGTKIEHMNIHTNDRPFMCDICGKAFKQNASLAVHKLFHNNFFPFCCQHCGKKFRRRSELKVHLWIHTGEKPHKCDVCPMAFRLRQDLNRHLKTHVKNVCDGCGLSFQQERFLNVHRKMHCTKVRLNVDDAGEVS